MEIIRGRWRGRMPYRCTRSRKPFDIKQGRTGEPSPASTPRKLNPSQMTYLLRQWMVWGKPLEFRYRLSRKKTVTVVGTNPAIYRARDGRPSLFLRRVQTIDGIPLDPKYHPSYREFLLSRIVSGLPKEILGREQQPELKKPLVSKIKSIRRRKIRWD